MSQIIAITDTAGAPTGAIVYWTLTGRLRAQPFREALAAIDPALKFPRGYGAKKALGLACAVFRTPTLLVRPAPLGGYTFVRESSDGAALLYDAANRVSLGGTGAEEVPPLEIVGECPISPARIEGEYLDLLGAMVAPEVGLWLAATATSAAIGGVTLRPSGGFYFIPPAGMEVWRKIADAVKAALPGARMYEVPAMTTGEGAEAVMDAIVAESKAALAELTEVLDSGASAKRLQGQRKRIDALLDKVRRYEALLGRSLDETTEAAESLAAEYTQAILAADAEGEVEA